jgi:membrane protease YdiL (CAAX protease family)
VILLVLGAVVPWRGWMRLRELLAKPVADGQRMSLYGSTIAFQWFATGIVAWRAHADGFSAKDLGLVRGPAVTIAVTSVMGAGLLAGFQWFNLRRMGRAPEKLRQRFQAMAERILPRRGNEMALFFVVAVTAGICEEFLYRGFAMAVFIRAGLPSWIVVVLSSLLFGLAHLYQGRSGLLGTSLLGAVLGAARWTWGSVIPVVVWHTAVDLVAGVFGYRYLIHKTTVTHL